MKIRILAITSAFLILLLMSNSSIIAFAEPPTITFFSPTMDVINDTVGAEREFEIKIDQIVNVSWLINGTEVQTNESITEASYINKSAIEGIWNITAIAENQNGTATQTWIWNVAPKPSIASAIIATLSKPIFPIWFLIVILALVIISTALFTLIRITRPEDREYKEFKDPKHYNKKLQEDNKKLQEDIEQYRKRIKQRDAIIERKKKEYGEYERNKGTIKNFREKCLEELKEIRLSGERIKEKTMERVAGIEPEPFRDENKEALKMALYEYGRLISSIKAVTKEKEQIYEEEKRQSSELIGKLEKKGINVGLYTELLEDSNADGLKVLHSFLNYMNARLDKREFNSKTIRKLEETRERIDSMMVDWGIKIVPSTLLDFCDELLKETSLPEEVSPNEKTVEAIIRLINEMYIK